MFPVFDPASPQARAIHGLFIQVLWISAAIFAVMTGLIAIAIIRFRAPTRVVGAAPGAGEALPVQDQGSHRREIFWLIGPVLVVLWLAAISTKLVLAINVQPQADPPGDGEADVVVTGHQWWWEVRYPASGAVAANEVHIPIGRRLRVAVESADVVHSFWVPRLARKIDAVPGRTNHIWLMAETPGEYQGYCAEFCGTQHAWMRFKVFAHAQPEFDAWISAQLASGAARAAGSASAQVAAGESLFRNLTCIQCHAYAGVSKGVAAGPDLTHVATRTTLGGGVIENTPANLARWLLNPQAIKPGCKMPNFNLTDDQVAALVAFLGEGGSSTPRSGGSGATHP